MIADSVRRAGAAATYVDVSHYGRADARVGIWHEARDGGLIEPQLVYDGPTRAFLGQKAVVGTQPSFGGTLYGLMVPLHFGNFAGLLSQAVWGALGVAMCFVILSGLRLWVRRRREDRLWRGFARAMQVVGYGLPIGVVASAWGFFLTRPAGDPFLWTPWSFVIGAAAAIAIGLRVADEDRLGRLYQRLLAVGCLLLPVLRLATGGMTWAAAILERQFDVLTVDLLLLLAGAVLWAMTAQAFGRRRLEPAE
jgi:hypothetical protein